MALNLSTGPTRHRRPSTGCPSVLVHPSFLPFFSHQARLHLSLLIKRYPSRERPTTFYGVLQASYLVFDSPPIFSGIACTSHDTNLDPKPSPFSCSKHEASFHLGATPYPTQRP